MFAELFQGGGCDFTLCFEGATRSNRTSKVCQSLTYQVTQTHLCTAHFNPAQKEKGLGDSQFSLGKTLRAGAAPFVDLGDCGAPSGTFGYEFSYYLGIHFA